MLKSDLVHGRTYLMRWKNTPGRIITLQLYGCSASAKKPVFEPAPSTVRTAYRDMSRKMDYGYLVLCFANGAPGAEGIAPLKRFPIENLIDENFTPLLHLVPREFSVEFVTSCTHFVGEYEEVLRNRLDEEERREAARRDGRARYNHVVNEANRRLGDDPLIAFDRHGEEAPEMFTLNRSQIMRLITGNPTAR